MKPRRLGKRDEPARRDRAEAAVMPARQRFQRHDAPGLQLELRLVDQIKLFALEGLAQFVAQFDRFGLDRFVHVGEPAESIAPGPLGGVHGRIGMGKQCHAVRAVLRIARRADRDRHPQSVFAHHHRLAESTEHLARASSRSRRYPPCRQPPRIRHRPCGPASTCAPQQDCSRSAATAKRLIADIVAQRIVDALETIEIEIDHDERIAVVHTARPASGRFVPGRRVD